MTTIEQIHAEFDTAVDKLVQISEERQKAAESTVIPKEEQDYEDGKFLESIGFSNTSLAKKANEFDQSLSRITSSKEQNIEISKKIDEVVRKYQSAFPFHKFILYSQVLKICEKYNLHLAPSVYYKGDIPKKNIEEMKNFPWNRLQKDDKHGNQKFSIFLDHRYPIFTQNKGYTGYTSLNSNYICAPLNEFNLEGTSIIGKEIFEEFRESTDAKIKNFKYRKPVKLPKDPIILVPVNSKPLLEPGFLVVTKWGPEAEDPSLVVPQNN